MSVDIEKIKQIDIVSWMQKQGYRQGKQNVGKWRSFYSPFGSESNASFKINTATNKWKDYSAGVTEKSESIIDLVMRLNNCSFAEACDILSGEENVEVKHFEPKKQQSGVLVSNEKEITDTDLLNYFTQERKIDEDVLRKYTKQITVSFPFGKNPDKTYEAIGILNSCGGWDFRNRFLKMASAPKSFTKIKGKSNKGAILIEGFVDWLAYATFYNIDTPKYDVYILNGLGQLGVLKPFLENRKILLYLDNDTPADNAIKTLSELNCVDMRHTYAFFKDFGEFVESF